MYTWDFNFGVNCDLVLQNCIWKYLVSFNVKRGWWLEPVQRLQHRNCLWKHPSSLLNWSTGNWRSLGLAEKVIRSKYWKEWDLLVKVRENWPNGGRKRDWGQRNLTIKSAQKSEWLIKCCCCLLFLRYCFPEDISVLPCYDQFYSEHKVFYLVIFFITNPRVWESIYSDPFLEMGFSISLGDPAPSCLWRVYIFQTIPVLSWKPAPFVPHPLV